MENKWNWKEKLPKRNQLLLLLLIGVLLVVISIPTETTKTEHVQKEVQIETTKDDYVSQMEGRVKAILGKIEGVGQVDVMITVQTSEERVVEKDGENSIYSEYSDGSQSPYISKEILPKIEGVVVVAEGGGNAVVVKNITEAIQALFDIDTHKIKVTKGG